VETPIYCTKKRVFYFSGQKKFGIGKKRVFPRGIELATYNL